MNTISRFTKYTTQSEPAITISLLAALVLAVIAKYVNLTEDDLQLLGLMLVPVVAGIVTRLRVWSPASVAAIKDETPTPAP
jgi:hypothetical protein